MEIFYGRYVSLVTPVSGFQNTLFMMSEDPDIRNAVVTIAEMDRVEYAFEYLRSQLNSMFLQHPQHSVFPEVMSMVETMVGPVVKENPALESYFVESVKTTIESIMPWDKFLKFSRMTSGSDGM